MRFYLLIIAVAVLSGCSNTEVVKSYNGEGKVIEEYRVLKKDPTVREGRFQRFDDDGNIVEESNYVAGVLQGERILYFPSGQVMIRETYVDNTFDGPYKRYYASGRLREDGTYADNQMRGVWKFYYDIEGNPLKEEVRFESNMENGPFKEYHPNGTLTAEGTYADELEHGLTKVYDSTGVLIKEILYEYGRPLEYRDYRQDTLR